MTASDTKNARRSTRFPVTCRVMYPGPDGAAVSFTANISTGGLFLEAVSDLTVDRELDCEVHLVEGQEPVRLRGVVRRVDDEGAGIEFLPGAAAAIEQIRAFLSEREHPEERDDFAPDTEKNSAARMSAADAFLSERTAAPPAVGDDFMGEGTRILVRGALDEMRRLQGQSPSAGASPSTSAEPEAPAKEAAAPAASEPAPALEPTTIATPKAPEVDDPSRAVTVIARSPLATPRPGRPNEDPLLRAVQEDPLAGATPKDDVDMPPPAQTGDFAAPTEVRKPLVPLEAMPPKASPPITEELAGPKKPLLDEAPGARSSLPQTEPLTAPKHRHTEPMTPAGGRSGTDITEAAFANLETRDISPPPAAVRTRAFVLAAAIILMTTMIAAALLLRSRPRRTILQVSQESIANLPPPPSFAPTPAAAVPSAPAPATPAAPAVAAPTAPPQSVTPAPSAKRKPAPSKPAATRPSKKKGDEAPPAP